MNSQSLFTIIITLLLFDYVKERLLSFFNAKHFNDTPDRCVSDVYEEEAYLTSQVYKKTNYHFSIVSSTFSLLLVLIVFYCDGFAFLDTYVRALTSNYILQTVLYIGILLLGNGLFQIPFSYYRNFVIEENFGFNKMTPMLYFIDMSKSLLLTVSVGGSILALIAWCYQLMGSHFWIYTWIFITLFSIFLNLFYASLIAPLFNKQTPLEEGTLKEKLKALSVRTGFKLDAIFVIDGSKRSTKANAYFTGLGPKKRIVLYDTLIEKLTEDEIVAVFAHEVGHYKKKHIISNLLLSIILTGIPLYLLSIALESPLLAAALHIETPSFHVGLIVFSILYGPLSEFTGILMHLVSRKFEYQADDYAKKYSDAEDLISSLKKLSRSSLSNLTPHKATVFFYYSHPTLVQRVKNLRK